MSILRASLWAMVFHTISMFCFLFLLYFDLRRPALFIVSTYVVLNTTLTLAFLPLGQTFYGYGNMIAAATTFLWLSPSCCASCRGCIIMHSSPTTPRCEMLPRRRAPERDRTLQDA